MCSNCSFFNSSASIFDSIPAIECICKDVELLDKAEFFLLAERIFSDQDLRDEITKMVVGRRDRIEAGEAELQSTIEDLKEAGYWKSSRKE